ncbi:Rv2175c family DNA-binding protein [Cryobacterium sp. SO2]|uniref:Rv2175c family DNA-binding protein n=1 Tax=Cryobacterium sp. SO2 TaxID=1897060 RepID=UPI00223C8F6C|nr:Rv2175c family DNA-binding protein [Cryobacterium sp. SO2]WEO79030.1 Rv2175c family DNA-binding protein [Cryobacterium sp. SO2]
MTDSSSAQTHSAPSTDTTAVGTAWLAIPDLVEALGISQSRVRQLIEDKHLLAVRRDGRLSVPASFIRDGSPVGELRGTLIVLSDDGFTDEQAMEWLLEVDDSLGVPPIDALLAGRKAEVRRVAQALA